MQMWKFLIKHPVNKDGDKLLQQQLIAITKKKTKKLCAQYIHSKIKQSNKMHTLTAYVPVVLWASEWMLILLLETKVSLWSHEEGKSKTTLCTAQTQSTSGPKNSSGFTSFHSVYKAEPFITILVTSCAQLNEKKKNGLEHFKQNHHLLSFPLSR